MKQLIISRDHLETRVAVLEDGKLAEMYLERPHRQSLVGNVYKGRVENVLPGMDAAFVDIGLDRNGFLSVGEVVAPEVRSGGSRKIGDLLKAGRELLVQVTRDPMGGKGPRLTMEVGIPGRYVVYLPGGKGSGVSRRLDEGERERLRAISREVRPETGSVIVRTAAEGAGQEAIERDLRFLQRVWAGAERRAQAAPVPALVYAEAELAVRSARDLLNPDFSAVIVDDEKLHRRLVSYLRAVAPEFKDRVERHNGETRLFERFGLEQEMEKALARRVGLPSGGHIVIDHTEAMTVIDVNTGRYVGRRQLEDTTLKTNLEACREIVRQLRLRDVGGIIVIDHTEAMTVIDVNTGRYVGRRQLEDTTLKTNLEACREIVRQLRLRDVGGIIVIDFIDMTAKTNREVVLAALEAEFTLDRTKTYVMEISPLGLVEMTRQNVTQGLREIVTAPCPVCRGQGRVISEESALIVVERRLEDLLGCALLPVLRVEVHPRIAARLTCGSDEMLQRLETVTGRLLQLQQAGEEVPLAHVAIVPD
jgi:ribonuclease G